MDGVHGVLLGLDDDGRIREADEKAGTKVILLNESAQPELRPSRNITVDAVLSLANALNHTQVRLRGVFNMGNDALCNHLVRCDSTGKTPSSIVNPDSVEFVMKHSSSALKDTEVYLELQKGKRKYGFDLSPDETVDGMFRIAHLEFREGYQYAFPEAQRLRYVDHELDGKEWVLIGFVCQQMITNDWKKLPFGILKVDVTPKQIAPDGSLRAFGILAPNSADHHINGIKTVSVGNCTVGWDEQRVGSPRYAMAHFWYSDRTVEALVDTESLAFHGSGKANRNYIQTVMAYVFDVMLNAEQGARARPWYQSIVEHESKKKVRVGLIKQILDPGILSHQRDRLKPSLIFTLASQIRNTSSDPGSNPRIEEIEEDEEEPTIIAAATQPLTPKGDDFSTAANIIPSTTRQAHAQKRTRRRAKKSNRVLSQSLSKLEAGSVEEQIESLEAAIERIKSGSPPLDLEEVRKETSEKRANSLRERRNSVAFLKERTQARTSRANSEATTENDSPLSSAHGASTISQYNNVNVESLDGPGYPALINNKVDVISPRSLDHPKQAGSRTINDLATIDLPMDRSTAVLSKTDATSQRSDWRTVTRKKPKVRRDSPAKDRSFSHDMCPSPLKQISTSKAQEMRYGIPFYGTKERESRFKRNNSIAMRPKFKHNMMGKRDIAPQEAGPALTKVNATPLHPFSLDEEDYPALPLPSTSASPTKKAKMSTFPTSKARTNPDLGAGKAAFANQDRKSSSSAKASSVPSGTIRKASSPKNGQASPEDTQMSPYVSKDSAATTSFGRQSPHPPASASGGSAQEVSDQEDLGEVTCLHSWLPKRGDPPESQRPSCGLPVEGLEKCSESTETVGEEYTTSAPPHPPTSYDIITVSSGVASSPALDTTSTIGVDSQSPTFGGVNEVESDNPSEYWRDFYEPPPPTSYGHRLPDEGPRYAMSLDSVAIPCSLPFCENKCNSWDGTSVICPRCGPYSYIRYCSEQHLYADVKEHWLFCQTSSFSLSCNPSSIPSRHKAVIPSIPCLRVWDTPERHRQEIYHSLHEEGDYFLFDEWVQFCQAAYPQGLAFTAFRCKGTLKHVITFEIDDAKDSTKDRFNRLLNLALFDSVVCRDALLYLYRMIRSNLEGQKLWCPEVLQCLDYQMQFEFGLIGPPISTLAQIRHACIYEWNGEPADSCPNPTCAMERSQDGNADSGRGIRHLIEEMEARYWILRVNRKYHPTVRKQADRMKGIGFGNVSSSDQRVFARGEGWDGAGAGPMEIEGFGWGVPARYAPYQIHDNATSDHIQDDYSDTEHSLAEDGNVLTGGEVVQRVGRGLGC